LKPESTCVPGSNAEGVHDWQKAVCNSSDNGIVCFVGTPDYVDQGASHVEKRK